MKNTFNLLSYISLFLVFISCEKDESKDPLPSIVQGQYVRIDITKRIFDFDNINSTSFEGTITTPGNNVKEYILKVKRKNNIGIYTSDYIKIPLNITSFPYELKLTPELLASTLGINVSDFSSSDKFLFYGEAVGYDGTITRYDNLSSVIKSQPSLKQAFLFQTVFLKGAEFVDNYNKWDNFDLNKLN